MLRTPLVVGALVVLGAAVVLIVMLAQGGDDSSASATQKPAEPATPPAAQPTGRGPSVTVTDRPRGETPAPMPGAGEHPREYAVGDSPVRDHREGDNKPIDIPPNVHSSGSRRIPSTLTHEISQKVKAVAKDCVASLPKEGRGPKPRIEGQIVIAIKANVLSVTESTIQMRDLDALGAATEAAKQCVQSHAVGLSVPADGEPDLAAYTINLSYAVLAL